MWTHGCSVTFNWLTLGFAGTSLVEAMRKLDVHIRCFLTKIDTLHICRPPIRILAYPIQDRADRFPLIRPNFGRNLIQKRTRPCLSLADSVDVEAVDLGQKSSSGTSSAYAYTSRAFTARISDGCHIRCCEPLRGRFEVISYNKMLTFHPSERGTDNCN